MDRDNGRTDNGLNILCPYCLLHEGLREVLNEKDILSHMRGYHDHPATSIKNVIDSFKATGLYEEATEEDIKNKYE